MNKADFAIHVLRQQINPAGRPPIIRNILLIHLAQHPNEQFTGRELSRVIGPHGKLKGTLEAAERRGLIALHHQPYPCYGITEKGQQLVISLLTVTTPDEDGGGPRGSASPDPQLATTR